MRKLAIEYWAENAADPKKNTKCRINWVKSECFGYFFRGGKELYWDREMRIKKKIITSQENINLKILNDIKSSTHEKKIITTQEHINSKTLNDIKSPTDEMIKSISENGESSGETLSTNGMSAKCSSQDIPNPEPPLNEEVMKLKLLDVGSCYNPFGNVEFFEVTAVDLAPSSEEVLQCDFLSMKIGQENIYSDNKDEVLQLEICSFDTVVFCLLLEYLPSPEQRYSCCEKAYNLLKNGGLLLIVTPDSKHVGANAKFMKSWRHVLANLGFMRIKYEKVPHAHCLVFRKCFYKEVATRWASMKKSSKDDELFQSENKIFIPQDFTTVIEEDKVASVPDDEDTTFNLYNELPYT